MVYTERAETDSFWQQILVAPAMPALKYTTSVDIKKKQKQKRAIKSVSLM